MDNIATNFEQLYNKAALYTKTSLELAKLKVIDKTSDIISSLAVIISISMIVAMFTLFLNIGIALWIGEMLNNMSLGFLIISGFYVIVAIIVYVLRKSLIKEPIDNLIVSKLLETKNRENDITNLK